MSSAGVSRSRFVLTMATGSAPESEIMELDALRRPLYLPAPPPWFYGGGAVLVLNLALIDYYDGGRYWPLYLTLIPMCALSAVAVKYRRIGRELVAEVDALKRECRRRVRELGQQLDGRR